MPEEGRPTGPPRHDASYKKFFAHPRAVADSRRADMLWRVGTVDGGWAHIVVLIEFQSTTESRAGPRRPMSAT